MHSYLQRIGSAGIGRHKKYLLDVWRIQSSRRQYKVETKK